MHAYAHTVTQWKKMLENVGRWIDKAEAHAKAKSFDAQVLLGMRLAPDQHPLVRQIQASCDGAKFGAARLAGKDPPSHPDTEQTIAEIRQRIQKTVAYLETFSAKDFEGAGERKVTLPWLEGKHMVGDDYLVEMVVPNLMFHLTTTYAILRHAGVDLGKRDYLGALTIRDGV
jgi:hypothetical protein